ARGIALDEGDRARKLALEAAPVEDIEQEVGLGSGLELLDFGTRLCQLLAQPPHGRFGVRSTPLLGSRVPPRGSLRPQQGRFPARSTGFRAFGCLRGRSPGFLLHVDLLKKACSDSPRQDSAFPTSCHRLGSTPGRPYNRPMLLDSRKEFTQ